MEKERNGFVDAIRGIAMLLVILGHTMTGSTINSEQSFLYNIIWTIQMPLFFLISGYVTRFSRKITSIKSLWMFIARRTFSYLIPWLLWTIVIRGVIFGSFYFANVREFFENMSSGYWFLIAIWTISIIFGVSDYLASKICKSSDSFKNTVVIGLVYVFGMTVLGAIGFLCGFSFFCIKLTLYYMPFFFIGFVFGKHQNTIVNIGKFHLISEIVIALFLIVWCYLLTHFNMYDIEDNLRGIFIRALASLLGCVSIVGLGVNLNNSAPICAQKTKKILEYVGKFSLEIYLIHYLVLNIVKVENTPNFLSAQGMTIVMVNYVLTILLSVILVKILKSNRAINKVVFGR